MADEVRLALLKIAQADVGSATEDSEVISAMRTLARDALNAPRDEHLIAELIAAQEWCRQHSYDVPMFALRHALIALGAK